jgi:hypothetical protein
MYNSHFMYNSHLKAAFESKVIDFLMEKTVSVEAAAEGPRVKPKRQLTEAQLAALKKGRERLAAKRQEAREEPSEAAIAAAAAASVEAPVEAQPAVQPEAEQQEQQPVQPEPEQQETPDDSDDEHLYTGGLCIVM